MTTAAILGLRQLGEGAARVATRESFARSAAPFALAALAMLVVLALAFAWSRRARAPRDGWRVASGVVASLVVGYFVTLPLEVPTLYPMPEANRLTWLQPNASFYEESPIRPRVPYRTNSQGFRGAEWPRVREPGVVRVAVIGDSFVFGSGVEDEETLPEQLALALAERHPDRRFEVLNLGVPGNNLRGHVELFLKAQPRLHTDVTVLAITANDLVTWTPQALEPAAYQLGFFSMASFAFGPRAARLIWGALYALPEGSPDEEAAAARELERAAVAAKKHESALVVFTFRPDYARYLAPLANRARVTTLAPRESEVGQDLFIPNDGHPNAKGHAFFARLVAEHVGAIPELRAPVDASPAVGEPDR